MIFYLYVIQYMNAMVVTSTAATGLSLLYIKCKLQCRLRNKIHKISQIQSKKDSILYLKSMCHNLSSADELNDSILKNIRNFGYSEHDRKRIQSLRTQHLTGTEDFALTVIWAMLLHFEELNQLNTDLSSVNHEQNLVTF